MNIELAEYYREVLSTRTSAEHVYIDCGQIIECIGVEKTNELAISLVRMTTSITKKKKSRSAVFPHKRETHNGIAQFNRVELLGALKQAFEKEVAGRDNTRGTQATPARDLRRSDLRAAIATDSINRD